MKHDAFDYARSGGTLLLMALIALLCLPFVPLFGLCWAVGRVAAVFGGTPDRIE